MALKIGRLEVGLRLLVSFISIAIAYGYLGSYLSKLLSSSNYSPSSGNHLVAGSLIALAIAGVFAIPQSLGGLLAAIAALGVVYWQSNLINSLITVAISMFQIPESRLASAAIGAIGASFTMIGKQIQYLELRPAANFIILGILSSSSLIIGFVIRAIFYTPKPSHFL